MKMQLLVTMSDGSAVTTSASTADFVAFEERYDTSIAAFSESFKLRDVCFLAWHSLARSNPGLPEFTDWLNDVESVTVQEDKAEANPSRTTRRTSSSRH